MTGDATAIQLALALGTASILSVGPNNLTLMREGLVCGRVGFVAGLFSVSQGALAVAAYGLAAGLHELDATWRAALSWTAVAVLLSFALQSFRAAGAARTAAEGERRKETALACALRVLPIVWLNPLSYLECLFVPAAILQMLDTPGAEVDFLATLLVMILVCNVGYGFGGRLVGSVTRCAGRTRLFDQASGVVLCGVAAVLAVNLTVN